MDYDVVVIGAGAAGLHAASGLSKAGLRVLIIYSDAFGGQVSMLESVENFPAPGESADGAALAGELADCAAAAGAEMMNASVAEIETYSSCNSIRLEGDEIINAPFVIVATGRGSLPLKVPGEERFKEAGLIHCATCDASLYRNRTVAVCGGGDAGVQEALFLARFASRVILIEAGEALSAKADLRAKAEAQPRIEIRLRQRVTRIEGDDAIRAIIVEDLVNGETQREEIDGLLVRVGYGPGFANVASEIEVDAEGYIPVDPAMRSSEKSVFAIGDARAGSARTVRGAIADADAAVAAILSARAET